MASSFSVTTLAVSRRRVPRPSSQDVARAGASTASSSASSSRDIARVGPDSFRFGSFRFDAARALCRATVARERAALSRAARARREANARRAASPTMAPREDGAKRSSYVADLLAGSFDIMDASKARAAPLRRMGGDGGARERADDRARAPGRGATRADAREARETRAEDDLEALFGGATTTTRANDDDRDDDAGRARGEGRVRRSRWDVRVGVDVDAGRGGERDGRPSTRAERGERGFRRYFRWIHGRVASGESERAGESERGGDARARYRAERGRGGEICLI